MSRPKPALLAMHEAASRLRLTLRSVRWLCDEGKLAAFAVNADPRPQRLCLRVVAESIDDYHQKRQPDFERLIRTVTQWLDILDSRNSAEAITQPRQLIIVADAALALHVADTHVRSLFDAGLLRGLSISRKGATHQHLRIETASLISLVQNRLCEFNNLGESPPQSR